MPYVTVDVDVDLFSTTTVPAPILRIASTAQTIRVTGATTGTLDAATLSYLTELSDQIATWSTSTTVTVSTAAATNPVTGAAATKNEFNVYINGQYIDKAVYTWTPTTTTQSIVFDTSTLGYTIDSTDTIIINGRWA